MPIANEPTASEPTANDRLKSSSHEAFNHEAFNHESFSRMSTGKSSVRTPPGKEPSEELPKVRIPATGSPGGHRSEKEFLKEEFLEEERPSSSSGPVRTPDFFEETLPDLRDRLGWTQAELGAFFCVSRVSATRWENKGVGETEPRKAALRLVADCLESSPAPGRRVGEALLSAGVVGAVTAGVHRSVSLGKGRADRPVDPEEISRLRGHLGWTQVELAGFLGMTHSGPAVWESGRGDFREAVRAALLALRLAGDLEQEEYPRPDSSMEKLRGEGLSAFYRAACQLQMLEADA